MKIPKKSMRFVDFLKARFAGRGGRALIAVHDNPDPDTLAAALCLKRIFESSYGVEAVIGYGGIVGRAENREMVRLCGIPLERMARLDPKVFDYRATVDCQPGSGNLSLPPELPVDIVLDHHPRKPATRNIPWVDIRTKYGASATLALEYLLAHDLEPTRTEATALLYALKSETQDLGRESGPADRRAYFHLFPKADFSLLFDIVHAEVTKDYFRVLNRALENAKLHNDVLISSPGAVDLPDHVAEVADMLLRLKGIAWTLVMGRYNNQLFLSIRALRRDVDAGEIMQGLVDGLGNGGGHEMMAGGRVDLPSEGMTFEELETELSARFLKALRKRSPGAGLLKA